MCVLILFSCVNLIASTELVEKIYINYHFSENNKQIYNVEKHTNFTLVIEEKFENCYVECV